MLMTMKDFHRREGMQMPSEQRIDKVNLDTCLVNNTLIR